MISKSRRLFLRKETSAKPAKFVVNACLVGSRHNPFGAAVRPGKAKGQVEFLWGGRL